MSLSADPGGSEPASVPVGTRRIRARVVGTVQGVGFRPYVHRLASGLGLGGWVLNDVHGVLIEAEGASRSVDEFLTRLATDAPPLAVVERVEMAALTPIGGHAFHIRTSPSGKAGDAPVTPDAATCPDCLKELFDPSDRRFRYPFINCTNCGPRFTIVRGIPYDRRSTTMADFQMCAACLGEYEDPADRRFHAQPNACPDCGPAVRLIGPEGIPADAFQRVDPIRAAAASLRAGAVVAVKGIGGYHLACRADDEVAVWTLRSRKHREDKPFALMVTGIEEAAALIDIGDAERVLLSGPQRPIVVAPRRNGAQVAVSVAPGALELGVMLAYSPLHHLLLADVGVPLVLTSANVSDEPIAYDDADALRRLAGIADLQLIHDRAIETRTDDSVLRVVAVPGGLRPMLLRRSRGYVPASLPLPNAVGSQILACGGELKNTFCVARGSRAWVSHHVGDLKNYETLRSFRDGIEHFKRLFDVEPQVVVHDLHPDYLSTQYALELELAAERGGDRKIELVGVQHHHAHLAACLAEHGETGMAVGAIFDGTGYGPDGTVWGGELLVGNLNGFRRAGALAPVRMPGGERAISEPWRMACAWLTGLSAGDLDPDAGSIPAALKGVVDQRRWSLVMEMTRSGLRSPVTTSMGRLFDAAAALCGVRAEVNYEGQAAIEFEAACDPAEHGAYEIAVARDGDLLVMDPSEALRSLVADIAAGETIGAVAARFHAGIVTATVTACTAIALSAGIETVVLAGGVFQNRRLLEGTATRLHAAGVRVLIPERLPPGDGAISYGQAVIAARSHTTTGDLHAAGQDARWASPGARA